jgi:Ras-related protein Rap-1B
MRELYIKSGQGFILVYSVTDKNSLEELLQLREQVLRIKDSNAPMVLVGNKCDLLERELKPEDGIEVSERWGRVPFYETSARTRTNVDEAFVDVVRQIMRGESSTTVQTAQQTAQQKVEQVQPVTNGNASLANGNKAKPLGKTTLVKTTKPKKKKKSSCVIL